MKLALISEIHANLEALQATLDDIAPHSVDRIVCLGDIVGYNTKPQECIALLREVQAVCVAGNHDRAVCGQITTETFSNTAARAVRSRPAAARIPARNV
jgi:predicted phosphodiesterase